MINYKTMAKYDYIIGIDPDCDKSGVAVLSTNYTRTIELHSMPFPDLLDYLKGRKEFVTHFSFLIVVEVGWLNDSHWHVAKRDSPAIAAAKGNAVGRNHETGRKIVEMCKHYGLTYVEQRPLRKCWSGKEGKITHSELSQFIAGFPSKSNQETRDAALLAWNWAGFPIRMKMKL